jgi:hypothetical protein
MGCSEFVFRLFQYKLYMIVYENSLIIHKCNLFQVSGEKETVFR